MRTLRRVELLILLIVFASSFSMVSARAQHEGVQTLFEQAQRVQQEGREKEALELYERAAALGEKLGPNKRGFAVILNNLATLYMSRGQNDRAASLNRRVVQINEKIFGPDSPEVAMSLSNSSFPLNAQGKRTEAEAVLKRALEISLESAEKRPDALYLVSSNLAEQYVGDRRFEEAEEVLRQALERCENPACMDAPYYDRLQSHLVQLYQIQGRQADAENALTSLPGNGLDSRDLATARQFHNEGSLANAEALFQQAIVRLEHQLEPDDPDLLANALNELGDVYREEHSDSLAEEVYLRAETIQEEAAAKGNKYTAAAIVPDHLLNLYRDHGRMDEAEQFLRHVLAVKEAAIGPDRNEVAVTLTLLARFLEEEEKATDAAPLFKRAAQIQEKNLGEDPRTAQALEEYAGALEKLGENEQAAAVRARAKQMQDKLALENRPK